MISQELRQLQQLIATIIRPNCRIPEPLGVDPDPVGVDPDTYLSFVKPDMSPDSNVKEQVRTDKIHP